VSTAGRIALAALAARGELSFSTVDTVADRWAIFTRYAKSRGAARMELFTRDLARDYGRELAVQVEAGDMAPATAQNYLSAINTVMKAAAGGAWLSVSPVKDCGIEQRSAIRTDAPTTLDRSVFTATLAFVRGACGERAEAIVGLCREIGLRSKEASLLDAKASLRDATNTGRVTIADGTKGGRKRILDIRSRGQVDTLRAAAAIQGVDRSMIPAEQTWRQWREGDLRDLREATRRASGGGLHDLRAAYACERYAALTGHPAPCTGGVIADRALDHSARMTIAEELGHSRVEVVGEYIGGRR
jgi:hypothetical protein